MQSADVFLHDALNPLHPPLTNSITPIECETTHQQAGLDTRNRLTHHEEPAPPIACLVNQLFPSLPQKQLDWGFMVAATGNSTVAVSKGSCT